MSAPDPGGVPFRWDGDLDRRRARARSRALVVFVAGILIQAAYAATLACILLFAAARFQTFWTGDPLGDSPLWHYGLAGALLFALGAFVLTLGFTVVGAARGAATWLLKGLTLRPGTDDELRPVSNVVDALAMGLGVSAPEVLVIDEPTPNTISCRRGGHRTLCVTTGVLELPRHEIEAMCAHEMAQLHAPDSKLVSAAFMALLRARNASGLIGGIGVLLVVGAVGAALKAEVFLPSMFLVGCALAGAPFVALMLLMSPLYWVREAVVDLADVAAVYLARHPTALAAVLGRLAENERRVATTTERCELLWFEAVEVVFATEEVESTDASGKKTKTKTKKVDPKKLAAANERSRAELERRAALVTATARGIRVG